MKQKPFKKLIALVGEEDQKAAYTEAFLLHAKKVLTFRKGVIATLEEAIGRTLDDNFGPALKLESHHVRRFFNKMQLGVHSVQNYLGKVVNNAQEATDYFLNYIGQRAYGQDWILQEVIKQFEQEGKGLFLVTDLTLDDAKRLRTLLGSSFALVLVGEKVPEVNLEDGTNIQPKYDFHVKPQTTKAATKRVTLSVIDKINPTENRRNANERPTTESELQS